MDKDEIRRMAENPNFISGIYNFCDRWCERCPFTSRCMVHAMADEQFAEPESRDMQNELFWQKLGENFKATLEMAREMAAQQGITEEELKAADAMERKRERHANRHPLTVSAKRYEKMADAWFDSHQGPLEGKQDELLSVDQMELPGRNAVAEAEDIRDVFEVINWYKYQIAIKLMLAVSAEQDQKELGGNADAEEINPVINAPAKIALFGVDRSLAAWARLREHLPEQADPVLDILVHLDRLRRGIEKAFPLARALKRPGFDD